MLLEDLVKRFFGILKEASYIEPEEDDESMDLDDDDEEGGKKRKGKKKKKKVKKASDADEMAAIRAALAGKTAEDPELGNVSNAAIVNEPEEDEPEAEKPEPEPGEEPSEEPGEDTEKEAEANQEALLKAKQNASLEMPDVIRDIEAFKANPENAEKPREVSDKDFKAGALAGAADARKHAVDPKIRGAFMPTPHGEEGGEHHQLGPDEPFGKHPDWHLGYHKGYHKIHKLHHEGKLNPDEEYTPPEPREREKAAPVEKGTPRPKGIGTGEYPNMHGDEYLALKNLHRGLKEYLAARDKIPNPAKLKDPKQAAEAQAAREQLKQAFDQEHMNPVVTNLKKRVLHSDNPNTLWRYMNKPSRNIGTGEMRPRWEGLAANAASNIFEPDPLTGKVKADPNALHARLYNEIRHGLRRELKGERSKAMEFDVNREKGVEDQKEPSSLEMAHQLIGDVDTPGDLAKLFEKYPHAKTEIYDAARKDKHLRNILHHLVAEHPHVQNVAKEGVGLGERTPEGNLEDKGYGPFITAQMKGSSPKAGQRGYYLEHPSNPGDPENEINVGNNGRGLWHTPELLKTIIKHKFFDETGKYHPGGLKSSTELMHELKPEFETAHIKKAQAARAHAESLKNQGHPDAKAAEAEAAKLEKASPIHGNEELKARKAFEAVSQQKHAQDPQYEAKFKAAQDEITANAKALAAEKRKLGQLAKKAGPEHPAVAQKQADLAAAEKEHAAKAGQFEKEHGDYGGALKTYNDKAASAAEGRRLAINHATAAFRDYVGKHAAIKGSAEHPYLHQTHVDLAARHEAKSNAAKASAGKRLATQQAARDARRGIQQPQAQAQEPTQAPAQQPQATAQAQAPAPAQPAQPAQPTQAAPSAPVQSPEVTKQREAEALKKKQKQPDVLGAGPPPMMPAPSPEAHGYQESNTLAHRILGNSLTDVHKFIGRIETILRKE